MNTVELECLISHHVRRFDGVFSSDRLPSKPRLLMSNTQPSNKPGEHWIVIYVDDDGRYGEYFDSFGRAPTGEFKRYMKKHCRRWTYNRQQLQSIASRFCGYYCACYSVLRSRGVDISSFVRYFTGDTGLNDLFVYELICRINNI